MSPRCVCGAGIVSRVVLDSNVLQGGSLAMLASIHARGFRLSVSETAFAEYAARAKRNDERTAFDNRLRKVARFVDPQAPVMPVRRRFFSRFQPHPLPPNEVHSALKVIWDQLRTGVDEPTWNAFSTTANDWFDEKSGQFRNLVKRWEIGPDLDLFRRLGPRQRLSCIREHLYTAIPGEHTLVGAYRDRADIYFRVQASVLWASATGASVPTDNDLQDLEQLVHVGEPAFLLTEDRRLLDRVTSSGSRQRFWVVRPSEFLEWSLPCGMPWGTRAVKRSRRLDGRGAKLEAGCIFRGEGP